MSKKRRGRFEHVGGIRDEKDRREAAEVVARAFSEVGRIDNDLQRSRLYGDIFDPEHSRVAVADGRVVSLVVMAPRQMRFGPTTVPAMTIGPVGTDDRYRRQGAAAAAMDDASTYMAENGYLAAYLQGIPDFYHRFGYYPYMAPSGVKFQREQARQESRPGRLRAMTRGDLPAVARLYEAAAAGRIGPATRDSELWQWLLATAKHSWLFRSPHVILDGRGRLCGYLTVRPRSDFGISEIVVRPDEASCRAALGALVREAKRREIKEIELPMPWDAPPAVFLRQHVPCQLTLRSHSTGGSVMKIVDFPGLMRRIEPLLAERWAGARRATKGRFTFETPIGAVGIATSGGRVRVGEPIRGPRVHVPLRWLSGLLTGYYPVADVAPRRGVVVPEAMRPTLETLFPPGWPFVYQADNY